MVWPFKKKSQADRVIDIIDDAANFAAAKWEFFLVSIPFRSDVRLSDKIAASIFPITEGLNNKYPVLLNSPESIHFLILLKGIVKSGTHSKEELEAELGIELPELN